jgi:uncharacterized OB-fold protein
MSTIEGAGAVPGILADVSMYWKGANEGKLLIKFCRECSKVHWYPRAVCPHCLSAQTEWRQAKGIGTIYSFSTMELSGSSHSIAYVTLVEGVTMMSNIVDCDPAILSIGQSVRVVFVKTALGQAIPMFSPTDKLAVEAGRE